MAVTPMCS